MLKDAITGCRPHIKIGLYSSLTFPHLADKLCALEKSNPMKGGARPMLMNKFLLTPAFIGKADFDSRSAPASR
jgi:hypothetical protein